MTWRLALLGLLALLDACQTTLQPHTTNRSAQVAFVPARFVDLPGWNADAVQEAWPALLSSCRVRSRAEWREVCDAAGAVSPASAPAIRTFFESRFQPFLIMRTATGIAAAQTTGLLTVISSRSCAARVGICRAWILHCIRHPMIC